MKKNLSYRDKLLELANLYRISEIQTYVRNKKYLTTPQIEHILKKNKITIPTEVNKSLLEIQVKKITKPVYSTGNKIGNSFSSTLNSIGKFFTFISKSISKTTINLFFGIGRSIVKLSSFITKTIINLLFGIGRSIIKISSFVSKTTINFFNGIYDFKFQEKRANTIFTGIFVITFASLIVVAGFYAKDTLLSIKSFEVFSKTNQPTAIDKKDKNKVAKIPAKKPIKKKKTPKVIEEKAKNPKKKFNSEVTEFVLPNLNLKTETVLNLFSDVQYDLRRVRNEKRVKPIYFTQFPKDLDEISSVKIKKETFIKIVLPLVAAENQKILDDRSKLKRIIGRKTRSDKEKSWLKQKFKEYKVLKGGASELEKRMDIIPISIALAQAAKESGWGTSRFALEGNAIFGQWTWTGRGIEPLDTSKTKGHKVLRFPILRASVKAYKNNLNTHKGYKEFREKRFSLRKRQKSISGLKLIHTLDNYAETGKEYTEILEQIIDQNSLMDFDNVQLSNTVVKKQLSL